MSNEMIANENKPPRKGYFFEILLYPETESYDVAEVLGKLSQMTATWILHDKDSEEDGSPKKAHIHCILKTKCQSTVGSVSASLGVPKNYIEVIQGCNITPATEYLIHKNNPEKYQYGVDDITNLDIYNSFINRGVSNEENLSAFLLACDGWIGEDSPCTWRSLCAYLNKLGLWKFANSGFVVSRILQEVIDEKKMRYV